MAVALVPLVDSEMPRKIFSLKVMNSSLICTVWSVEEVREGWGEPELELPRPATTTTGTGGSGVTEGGGW